MLATGDVARAHELVEQALTVAGRTGAVMDEIFARRTLARVLLAPEDTKAPRAVADALDGAERLIERTGATSYRPLMLVERAALARLVGDVVARRRALAEAAGLFTAIGAIGHAERLARERRA